MIADLTKQLATATGESLFSVTDNAGWQLFRPVHEALRYQPKYGMPSVPVEPAKFAGHIRQAIWAAEQSKLEQYP